MSEAQNKMRKAQARKQLPAIDLFPRVQYNGKTLDVALFGPNAYGPNREKMQERYFHSDALSNITFRPLSTTESLAVASHDFSNLAKPHIFNPRWLQAGYILRTQEGVWVNPVEDAEGKILMDAKELEKRLDKKVNGIYLLEGDTSFVPYDSFERGVQEHETFLEGGLARGLMHTTDKKATILAPIANNTEYPRKVDVWGFDSVKEPALRVVSLDSGSLGGRLYVGGDGWYDFNDGFAFGGLVSASGEASARKI